MKSQIIFYSLIFLLGLTLGVVPQAQSIGEALQKQVLPVQKTPEGTIEMISGEIVRLPFINKMGVSSKDAADFYLRASIQDYFIKFCESKITREMLQKFEDKAVTLEVIKKNGNWDSCGVGHDEQSRTGLYVQVVRVLSPN